MSSRVETFIQENKQKRKQIVLDALGLFDYEKEYAPDDLNSFQARDRGFVESERIDGKQRFFKRETKVYPEVSDAEFEQLEAIYRTQEHKEEQDRIRTEMSEKPVLDFELRPVTVYGNSFAAKFLKAIAIICWIGGLITSIALSIYQESGYYSSSTKFSFQTFITYAMIYFVVGGLCMCLSEVCENISRIASSTQEYKLKQEKK